MTERGVVGRASPRAASGCATKAATTSTTAPPITTIHAGSAAAAPSANAMPTSLEERAAGLRQRVALQQVLARQHVGDRGRLHGEHHANHRLRGEQSQDQHDRGTRSCPASCRRRAADTTMAATTATIARRDEVGPPHDATSREPVDEHTDERRQQGVRHVQRQDDLQQVVGRRHVLDVEPFLAAERDRLADRALDDALAGLDQELHTHQDREVAVGEHAEQPVEEPSERLERAPEPCIADPQRRPRAPTATRHDDPGLRRRRAALATPRAPRCPTEQEHDHGHARDERDAVDRRCGCSNQLDASHPGTISRTRQQQDHEQVLREVVERAGVVESNFCASAAAASCASVDDVRRRAPQAVALDHVDVGADLDPLRRWRRRTPAARRRPCSPRCRCTGRRSTGRTGTRPDPPGYCLQTGD